jgi:5'/3'-nucleotidase SurE
MRGFTLATLSALLLPASGLNILLNNDDSYVSANIREFYKALKAAGHKVLLVAPVTNQSGKGGTVCAIHESNYALHFTSTARERLTCGQTVFTDSKTLYGPGEFNAVAAGAPSVRFLVVNDFLNNFQLTSASLEPIQLTGIFGTITARPPLALFSLLTTLFPTSGTTPRSILW